MAEEETDVQQDAEDSSSEKTVPYDRFKEVNEQRKVAEEENKTLKEQPKGEPTDQQKAEQQADEYISKKVEERLDARDKIQKEKEATEQKEFNSNVDDLMSVHTDVKRDEFLKFIEENDAEFEFSSPKAAMATYRKLNNLSKEAEDKVKDDLEKKPSMPKHEGTKAEAPIDDSNKTLQQIVQEEQAKLEK